MSRKSGTTKKVTSTKKGKKQAHVPRRSSSQFRPLEAVAVRDTRPTAIEWNEKSGQYLVRYDNKIVGRCNSMSAARRLRAKTEASKGYALTPAKIKQAVKRYQKSRES